MLSAIHAQLHALIITVYIAYDLVGDLGFNSAVVAVVTDHGPVNAYNCLLY